MATNLTSDDLEPLHEGISEEQLMVIKVFSILVAILGTTGNSLVIIAICRSRLFNQPIYVKILNLTVCNWIHSAIFLPLMALQAYTGLWTNNTTVCNLVSFGLYSNLGTELWGYVCITLNRYLCVLHHQMHDHYYKQKWFLFGQFVLSWSVYPIILALPLFNVWSHYEYAPKKLVCHPFIGDTCNSYCFFVFLLSFLTTLPVIGFCYGQILLAYMKVRKELNRVQHTSASDVIPANHTRLRAELKLAFTILTVILMFGTFRVPFLILYMYDPAVTRVNPFVHTLLIYVGANSNWVNPFIYAYSNKSIRQAVREILFIIK